MSRELSDIAELAANLPGGTVYLSGESLAVLFYAQEWLDRRSTWHDQNTGYDDVSDADYDTIQALVAGAYRELMTPMIGHIVSFATTVLPGNVLRCDGATYNKADYPDLYNALHPAYQISSTQFVVPDLMGRVVVGEGGGAGLSLRMMNERSGLERTLLTVSNLPAHTHTNVDHSHVDTGHVHSEVAAVPSLVTPGEIPVPIAAAVTSPAVSGIGVASIQSTQIVINSTGGDESHENMPPFCVLTYGIVAR